MKTLLASLLVLAACSPLTVVDDVNAKLGRQAVSFASDCDPRDNEPKCVVLVWRSFAHKSQLGLTLPPASYGQPWIIAIDESIRDDLETVKRVLVHEIGHVLGLRDDPVSGHAMSSHLTDKAANELVNDLRIELALAIYN